MLFNKIGKTYNSTRGADERIVAGLIRLTGLQKGSILADIGAGTGNYALALADAGYRIKAVEPSSVMLSHAPQNVHIEWLSGYAEDIPLQTNSVDSVYSVLALPHFSDIKCAFGEMARVLKGGPIVIFNFDPAAGKKTWMYSYFPFCWDKFCHIPTCHETAEILTSCTNLSIHIIPFKLPPDLKDNFAAAAWRNPHRYLDRDYRHNISSFRMTDAAVIEASVNRLASDLGNGRWEKLYGDVLHMESLDAGYYFLLAK